MTDVSLRDLALTAFLVLLLLPAAASAAVVYYSDPGSHGIQSIAGEIVRETDSLLEIVTADGEKFQIPRSSVYQIVRNGSAAPTPTGLDRDKPRPGLARRVGITGGMTFANVSVDPQDLEDGSSLQSFAVGMWWSIPVNRMLAIQPEAFYAVKGDAETFGSYKASTKLAYIDVPVLAKVRFLHGNAFRPSLFGGPLVAMNVSAKSTLEGEGSSLDVDVKDQVRRFEAGFVVGGGLELARGPHTFGVDVRYSRSLSNIAGKSANGNGHNDVIEILGSFGFQ